MWALVRTAAPRNGRLVRVSAVAAAFQSNSIVVSPFAREAKESARYASSNSRWKQRQGNDFFAREAKVQGLKSRAAFKLLEVSCQPSLKNKRRLMYIYSDGRKVQAV